MAIHQVATIQMHPAVLTLATPAAAAIQKSKHVSIGFRMILTSETHSVYIERPIEFLLETKMHIM